MTKGRRKNVITKLEAHNQNLFTPKNKVVIYGEVQYEPEYSYQDKNINESMYRTRIITIKNNREREDLVPVSIPKTLIKNLVPLKGKFVEIAGIVKTYRKDAGDGHRYLNLYVYVNSIKVYEDEERAKTDEDNLIYLNGYICKKVYCSQYKTDFLIAVGKNHGKADYIPCIAWGEAVNIAANLKVGDHVKFWGRFQSKYYFKQITPTNFQERTAYEVATNKIYIIE